MNAEKLTLEHLAPYLPYEVKLYWRASHNGEEYKTSTDILNVYNIDGVLRQDSFYKPILRPLSDLTKEFIEELNVDISTEIELEALRVKACFCPSYEVYKLCFKNHIDVFGLIDKGIAVDINTLKD